MQTRKHLLPILLLMLCATGPLPGQEEEAPAAAAEAQEVPVDVLDAQAQQYEQMLQPKKWRELEFIKQTCNLTPQQRPTIKAAADASVKQAAKELLRNMRAGNQGDVGVYIRKDLVKVLEKTLTPEQLVRYNEEAARRSAAVKKTTIRSTVALLDGYLYMSREQRDKIMEALTANWQEGWEQWLMISMYGGRYFPMIPDEQLIPHLNDQQQKVWQGAQKINPGWGGGGLRQQANDDWWEGKAETEKQETNTPKVEARQE